MCYTMDKTFKSIKFKRKLTYATILLYNLSTGVGYAIVFPTIWNYIHLRLGGGASMLGLAISAYSLSALFANPLIGWWNDRNHNTRLILLLTILAEVLGSFMYFLGISTWFLVCSRLVAGFGGGGGAAVIADVTRTTSEEGRTSVLAVVVASRQLGLLVGPALNLFLSQTNFQLFSHPVDQYTSPGLFMAVLWIIIEVMVFFAYHNLTTLKNDEDMERLFENYKRAQSMTSEATPFGDMDISSSLEVTFNSSFPGYSAISTSQQSLPHSSSHPSLQLLHSTPDVTRNEIESINCQKVYIEVQHLSPSRSPKKRHKAPDRAQSVSDKMIESAERLILSTSESYGPYAANLPQESMLGSNSRHTSSGAPSTPFDVSLPASIPDEKTSLLHPQSNSFLRDEIIVLLGSAFISCFAQTTLETVVTPLAQTYYSFTEMENSWIFFFAGIEVILVFAIIQCVSWKVSDRGLLAFGLITLATATGIPLIFVPSAKPGDMTTLPYFILTIIVDLAGIAVILVSSSSLLSKLTRENNQALSQGLRRSMACLGCIMGPLWGGTFLPHLRLLFSIPLAVVLLITVLFACSFKRLKPQREAVNS